MSISREDDLSGEQKYLSLQRRMLSTNRLDLEQAQADLLSYKLRLYRFEDSYRNVIMPVMAASLGAQMDYSIDNDDEDEPKSRDHDPEEEPAVIAEKEVPVPTQELKDLYRRAAKSLHPDLGVGEVDQRLRAKYMSQLNEAYQAGDLDWVQTTVDEFHETVLPATHEPLATTLARVARLIDDVLKKTTVIRDELNALKKSFYGEHLRRAEDATAEGWDYLASLADEFRN